MFVHKQQARLSTFGCCFCLSLLMGLISCGGPGANTTSSADNGESAATTPGGNSSASGSTAKNPIGIALAPQSGSLLPNETTTSVGINITRPKGDTANVTVSVSGLPSCVSAQTTNNPGASNTGSVVLSGATCEPGTYAITFSATDGTSTSSASFALTIPVLLSITNTAEGGRNGDGVITALSSTSIPVTSDASTDLYLPNSSFGSLDTKVVRLITTPDSTPLKPDGTWDFSTLDGLVEAVTSTSGVELVLTAPALMCDQLGNFMPSQLPEFEAYAAQVVSYYNNPAGFTDSLGAVHSHSVWTPVQYLSIFEEPDLVLTADEYANAYNVIVPAALRASVAPLRFVALDLSGSSSSTESQQTFIDTFVSEVTAQVDVLAIHLGSGCGATDKAVLDSVDSVFVPEVASAISSLGAKASLSSVPIWAVLNTSPTSSCSAATPTPVGLFAATVRAKVYSQLATVGVAALFDSHYVDSLGMGDIDQATATPHLTYWSMDYLLGMFCGYGDTCGSHTRLQVTSSELDVNPSVEVLATGQSDDSLTVMIVDHAASPSGVNGQGEQRTVMIDTSAAGTFTAGTELDLDANTDPALGPQPYALSNLDSPITVTMQGYGITIIHLIRNDGGLAGDEDGKSKSMRPRSIEVVPSDHSKGLPSNGRRNILCRAPIPEMKGR